MFFNKSHCGLASRHVCKLAPVRVTSQGQISIGHEKLHMRIEGKTGENVELVEATGHGELYCAHEGSQWSLVQLQDESLSMESRYMLAFEQSTSH